MGGTGPGEPLMARHERYFEWLEAELDRALSVAERARERGDDPSDEVEIPVARDMADRVEKVLDIPGVADRVRDYEADPSTSREEAALELARAFAEGEVGDYDTPAKKVEGAVRTAVALLTEGVVAAPIEGIDRVEAMENDDGTECVRVFYAGPIRSAGGTAQALSVLVADYTRTLVGLSEYKPRDEEVERYAEEVGLYDDDTGLQYSPKDEETKFIARNTPICLDGEATGDLEVSGFRDLDRVGTNNPRGGMCLVLAEGIAQKAPKIQRYTDDLDEVEWPWLEDLVAGTVAEDDDADEGEAAESEETPEDEPGPAGPPRPEPAKKYLRDLIAGRPVFSHPSEPGGFRLRYGRARNHGFATAGVHPATMHLVDDFLATGTQIKTERPGKAAGVVPVDSIEGPTVRLANGDVRRIDDPEEALELRNGVDAVLDLGEYLVNYGEFVENNHPLAPASYTVEWWVQDAEAAGAPVQAWRDDPHTDLAEPTASEALEWAREYDAPLHPAYTYLWHDIGVEALDRLAAVASEGRFAGSDGASVEPVGAEPGRTLVLPREEGVCGTLEALLVEHSRGEETVTVPDAAPLVASLGLSEDLDRGWTLEDLPAAAREYDDGANAVEAVNHVAPFAVRERAPTRIGNRMGRPEKSEDRELSPAVHTLFPIGETGGDQRDVAAAAGHTEGMRGKAGQVELSVARQRCPACGTVGFQARCPECDTRTEPVYECEDCGRETPEPDGKAECPNCGGRVTAVQRTTVDVAGQYSDALETVGAREREFPILKGVKGLTSARKLPEPMGKGVLRSKHSVSAFKDGTVRYDMTDLPVTAVRPAELDVTAEQFRELGYERDVDGEVLRHDDQLVELRVQDVVLSDGAAEHMLRTADFVDDLLERYYGLAPFYEFDERDDLVGELVFGMAPHTSAAVVGRVAGFTSAAVGYAHPYFHAAKRRNCFHPDAKLWYEDDGELEYGPLSELVDGRLAATDEVETDDVGTEYVELDDPVYVPGVTEDGENERQRVTHLSRHPAPDHMATVEGESGNRITVTPGHDMLVYDTEKHAFAERRASEVSEDDWLVFPEEVDVDGRDPEYDLLRYFLRSDAVANDQLMVRGIGKERLERVYREATGSDGYGYIKPLAEAVGENRKTLSNYLYRDAVPASLLLELLGDADAVCARVPDDVRLGVKRNTAGIERFVELDGTLSTLLGYYAAEGFTRDQAERPDDKDVRQVTISATEPESRRFALEAFDEVFGADPYEENESKITASGHLLAVVFEELFDCGTTAAGKRVPEQLFSASRENVAAYLGGYVSGDGSVSDGTLAVEAVTVSEQLRDDLIDLYRRLGVKADYTVTSGRPLHEAFPGFYDDDSREAATCYSVRVTSEDAVRFATWNSVHLPRKRERLRDAVDSVEPAGTRRFGEALGQCLDPVASVEYERSDLDAVYNLTTENGTVYIDKYLSYQCDGDEDCVMLLMDGLLNFSKSYLPDKRGGRMDAPLVMTSRIDPSEIDDEAHNMDIVEQYPREFYEATRRMADPGEVDVRIAEETLGTDRELSGFRHTHDTTNIAAGPSLSAYKTLGDMTEKMNHQLELARTLRAVDETDVAERVIEYHFLPDIIGNLRAFSRQEVRCLDCGHKYRRAPLTGHCRECGADRMTLTVHEGSVTKYIDTATRVAEEYGCRDYTLQRLRILEQSIDSVFQDDTNKQSGIADFM